MSKVYEVITGQIVEQLERGVVPWARPWKVDGLAPSNLVSRRPYRGINVFLLGFRAASTPWWLTFRQAKALGGSVRAGERSTPVIFWRWVDRAERGIDDASSGSERRRERLPVLRYYSVFNLDQTEGIDVPKVPAVDASAIDDVPSAEEIVARFQDPPAIEHLAQPRAFYRPSTDSVTMPPRSAFERAESASTTDRTQLQRMLTYCRTHRGRIHFLVVYMLDRFARNQYDHHALKAHLQKLGITLRAVAQPIDDSSTGKLMDGILAAFNEFDNNVRRERCVGGIQAAASKGRWVFPPPLGYRIALKADGTKTIEPDPEAAPLVRHAFAMAASGLHSVADILREVRRRGLTGRRGATLSSTMMHKILRKTVYQGRVVVEEWGIDVAGDFEPLVDAETFLLAQAGRDVKRQPIAGYQRNHPDFPLRRFVVVATAPGR